MFNNLFSSTRTGSNVNASKTNDSEVSLNMHALGESVCTLADKSGLTLTGDDYFKLVGSIEIEQLKVKENIAGLFNIIVSILATMCIIPTGKQKTRNKKDKQKQNYIGSGDLEAKQFHQ